MTDNENLANIMLQHLVRELTKLWRGEPSEIKNAWDAYIMCSEIAEMTVKQALRNAANEIRPGCVRVKIPDGVLPKEVNDGNDDGQLI